MSRLQSVCEFGTIVQCQVLGGRNAHTSEGAGKFYMERMYINNMLNMYILV